METTGEGACAPINGGWGRVPAWGQPHMVLTSPAGIMVLTPANSIWCAGSTASYVSNDLTCTAQRDKSTLVAGGIVWFTYGKASNPAKPNQETGIKLHAATGSVSVRAQSAAVKLTADRAIDVSSTHDSIRMGAPKHLRLTAGGSALILEGENITLVTPGAAIFKASMKELTGPVNANTEVELPPVAPLRGCSLKLQHAADTGGQFV